MFRAVFLNGPLEGAADVDISAPSVPERLFFTPAPAELEWTIAKGHLLVGYDQAPETPWPGQLEYRLDRGRSELRAHSMYEGQEEGLACYALA